MSNQLACYYPTYSNEYYYDDRYHRRSRSRSLSPQFRAPNYHYKELPAATTSSPPPAARKTFVWIKDDGTVAGTSYIEVNTGSGESVDMISSFEPAAGTSKDIIYPKTHHHHRDTTASAAMIPYTRSRKDDRLAITYDQPSQSRTYESRTSGYIDYNVPVEYIDPAYASSYEYTARQQPRLLEYSSAPKCEYYIPRSDRHAKHGYEYERSSRRSKSPKYVYYY